MRKIDRKQMVWNQWKNIPGDMRLCFLECLMLLMPFMDALGINYMGIQCTRDFKSMKQTQMSI